jgi:hypothetical protein
MLKFVDHIYLGGTVVPGRFYRFNVASQVAIRKRPGRG